MTMTPHMKAMTFNGLVIVTVSIVVVGAIFSVQIRELIKKINKPIVKTFLSTIIISVENY